MVETFDISTFNRNKYEKILARGLCTGMGKRGKQVCIEAALCDALGLPHGDDPKCVTASVRHYKIALNDSPYWGSPASRAKGLHDLGIAQLGSRGVVKDEEFVSRLALKTINILLSDFLEERGLIVHALACRKAKDLKDAASAATFAASATEKWLVLSAKLALEVLRELGSPGCALLEEPQ